MLLDSLELHKLCFHPNNSSGIFHCLRYFPPSGMAVKNIVMLINLLYYLVMESTIGPLLWIVCNGLLSDRIREVLGDRSITMMLVR